MDKLTMAHDWAMKHGKADTIYNREETIELAWRYADNMQAEANKREVNIKELMKDHVHDYIYGRICACGAIKE